MTPLGHAERIEEEEEEETLCFRKAKPNTGFQGSGNRLASVPAQKKKRDAETHTLQVQVHGCSNNSPTRGFVQHREPAVNKGYGPLGRAGAQGHQPKSVTC